ncbi:hypothetical protein FCV25MIE_20333, partial [Fagus crenata]
ERPPFPFISLAQKLHPPLGLSPNPPGFSLAILSDPRHALSADPFAWKLPSLAWGALFTE